MRFKRAKAVGSAAALAVIAAAGSVTTVHATEDGASPADGSVGEKAGAPEKIDSRVVDKDDSHIRIELKDKRQVSLTYAKDKGLVERHRPAEGATGRRRRRSIRRRPSPARALTPGRTATRSL
ncbi:hypothetical protein ABZ820_20760 [Streptomyces diacarni]|uniref:hypothetical protein n=1 Tax=Streptomyces diacarni TaxID=2800381 RepID=UPI00340EA175